MISALFSEFGTIDPQATQNIKYQGGIEVTGIELN